MKNLMGRVSMKMRENKRNGRKALKGFTLVEIIVVLVILAILAAAMIPALTGYIDKAKAKTAIAEARNVATAAQTLASESYALKGVTGTGTSKTLAVPPTNADIINLADVGGSISGTVSYTGNGKVLSFTYVAQNGETVTYDSSRTVPFMASSESSAS